MGVLLVPTLRQKRFTGIASAFAGFPPPFENREGWGNLSQERMQGWGNLQLIKGGYSREFGLHFGLKKEVWQRGFTEHRIRDAQDFELHRGYIHQNPVKRGLVERPEEYRYCSAFPGFRLYRWPPAAKAVRGCEAYGTSELVPFP